MPPGAFGGRGCFLLGDLGFAGDLGVVGTLGFVGTLGVAGGGLRFAITNLPSIIGFDKIGWCEKSLLGACPTSIFGLD